jgi:hypothetical protein
MDFVHRGLAVVDKHHYGQERLVAGRQLHLQDSVIAFIDVDVLHGRVLEELTA